MKKFLSMLLCLTMLLGTVTIPAFAADEEAVVNVKLTELLFIGSDGSAIGEIPDTNVKARATVTAKGAETVSLYVAAYNADGSLASVDVSTEEFTGDSTKIMETPIGADAKDADRVSAFVWKSSLTPVVDRVDLGSQAILLGADITVPDFKYNASTYGDYTFDAVVNNESKNVTFYIPYTTYSNEINAQGGTSYPGVTPNVDAVTYSLDTVGTASLAENTPTDAEKLNSIIVTSPDGTATQTYAVDHKFVAVERRFNDFKSANVNNTNLSYSSTDVIAGNVYFNQNITIPADKVTVGANKDKIDFEFSNSNKMRFRASQLTSEEECQHNDHFIMNFKFCIDSFTTVTDGTNRFAYANISDVDSIVFVATGDNTFVLNHREQSDNGKGERFENCPELENGKWYTYTHVFDKNPSYESGYMVSGYIDGKYIGSCADATTAPKGTFDRNVAQEMDFAAFGSSTFKGSFSEFELMSVMGDEKYEGKKTVHILGDSIARFYDSDTTAISQEGWGYALSQAFDSSRVRFLNHSVGGYNSNIYLNGANRGNLKSEPIWQSIERYIKPGDYVLIAIGRNETNSTDGTKTTANFTANLKTLAEKCKAVGAVPVFVNPIPKVNIADGVYSLDNDVNYISGLRAARDMRAFASENGYALLDLNAESYHTFADMTSDELKTIYKNDENDGIHITEKGANLISKLLVDLIAQNDNCNLKDFLTETYDANHAYVKSATAIIDGKTYTADVNTDSNTITFEAVLLADDKTDKVTTAYPDASAATVNIVANGIVAGIDETVDLTTAKTITVTQGTDVQTYTVKFDKAQYARTYNANGLSNDDGSQQTLMRRYIIANDSTSGNTGFGAWFAENAVNSAGTAEDVYGTIRAAEGVVKFNKTKVGDALNLGSFASNIRTQNANDKIAVEFKVKVNSLSGPTNNQATVYINSAHLDQILLTRLGAPEGKFFLGYRPNTAADEDIYTYTDKPLSFGEEYTVKYVYVKDAARESGYRCEIYLDGSFVTETDFRYKLDSSSKYSVPGFDICVWPSEKTSLSLGVDARKAQILIRTFSNALADIEFDDFVITCIPTT